MLLKGQFHVYIISIYCKLIYISGGKIADTHYCRGVDVYLKPENIDLLTNNQLDRSTVSDDNKATSSECYTITLNICSLFRS